VRYLPHVAVATLAVVAVPLALVTAVQMDGELRSPWLSMLVAVLLSVAISSAGSAFWMRRPASRDLVFGDLMLWGFIRRLRAEKRISSNVRLLEGAGSGADMETDERLEGLALLASSLEARDPYTHGHTRRVTRHSEAIAREMGLSQEQVAKVRTAAALHDVGKVLTPRSILTKPAALTDEEYEVVKRHPGDGAQMVRPLGDDTLTAIVRSHHERLDGSGYPDGLEGTAIPLGARIVAVADTFDAMTSTRPYRRARSHKTALDTLSGEAGSQLDADAVSAFLAYYSGRRTVAWGAFGIAAPQRLLAWVLDVGAAPLAKGVYAAGAAALIGGSLAMPEMPSANPGTAARAAEAGGGSSPTISPGSGRRAADGGPVRSGERQGAARGPVGGQRLGGADRPRTRTGPGLQGPAAIPAPPAPTPDGPRDTPQGGSGNGGTAEPTPDPAPEPLPLPTEVSVPGVQTPGGGVHVTAPGVDLNVQLPPVRLPGVTIPLPKVTLPLPEVKLPLLGPR
jgi:putative nucleotidyltransferase with HDIG domain